MHRAGKIPTLRKHFWGFWDLGRVHFHWVFCALFLTAANVWKPIHLDDVIWVHFARHIAEAPLDPFGFIMPWGYNCIPAMEMWSPPVLPYWWGAGVALFGENPALWKVWFLPFNLLFVASVFVLAVRFVPVWVLPVGYALSLSPTVLPATNLMQDVPAAALVLASLATVLSACTRQSLARGVLGGVLLGLACLTKWSALSGFGVIGLACLLFAPSWRWWVFVPGVAALIFLGWEAYLFRAYGQSNFFLSISGHASPDAARIKGLMIALLTYVGALAPFIAIAGWSTVGGRRLALLLVIIFLGAFLALAGLPETMPFENPLTGRALRLDTPILAALGLLVWSGLLVSMIAAMLRGRRTLDRTLVFLVLWVALELAGYFLLSPFPAARRLITLLVAVTLLTVVAAGPRLNVQAVRLAAGLQIVVAVLFALVDFADATRIRHAADQVITTQITQAQGAQVWVKGEFGFNYYSARLGGRPPCKGDVLQPDDILVLYVAGEDVDSLNPETIADLETSGTIVRVEDLVQAPTLPLTTMGFGYYLGRRPVEGSRGPLHNIAVFKITEPMPWARFAPDGAK